MGPRTRRIAGVVVVGLVLGAGALADEARPRMVEDVPPGATLQQRMAEIAQKVQQAVEYPELARRRGIEGTSLLSFRIQEGRAADVETTHTSGSALLDGAARDGALAARALPYVYGRIEVPVQFRLDPR